MVLLLVRPCFRCVHVVTLLVTVTLAAAYRRSSASTSQGEDDAYAVLARLRAEPWATQAERQLEGHAYVVAAEAGTLTLAQRRAFVGEQYSVQASDAR